jgi:LDH2 family malate/lactate/ureidoglycolate dehydrogenase
MSNVTTATTTAAATTSSSSSSSSARETYSFSLEEIREHQRTVSFAVFEGVHTPSQSDYYPFGGEVMVVDGDEFAAYLQARKRMEAAVAEATAAGLTVTSAHDYTRYGWVLTT